MHVDCILSFNYDLVVCSEPFFYCCSRRQETSTQESHDMSSVAVLKVISLHFLVIHKRFGIDMIAGLWIISNKRFLNLAVAQSQSQSI